MLSEDEILARAKCRLLGAHQFGEPAEDGGNTIRATCARCGMTLREFIMTYKENQQEKLKHGR